MLWDNECEKKRCGGRACRREYLTPPVAQRHQRKEDEDSADEQQTDEAIVDEHVEMIALVCSTYEVGTVVTRHGNSIARRSRRRAA